jgi:hypothetical protein
MARDALALANALRLSREMAQQSEIKYDGPVDLIAPIDLLAAEICRLTGYPPEPSKHTEQPADLAG